MLHSGWQTYFKKNLFKRIKHSKKVFGRERFSCCQTTSRIKIAKSFVKVNISKNILNSKIFLIKSKTCILSWFYFVSRWFEKIAENPENAPFVNWNIGILIVMQNKSEALIRLTYLFIYV